eukprot:Pompholyxophrys_punicea_v1_NODE_1234_length_839_cov_11.636709.p2 type:complete len:106 gc:universal NODE_1234_length_839_cov_11.636709:55-372(+)
MATIANRRLLVSWIFFFFFFGILPYSCSGPSKTHLSDEIFFPKWPRLSWILLGCTWHFQDCFKYHGFFTFKIYNVREPQTQKILKKGFLIASKIVVFKFCSTFIP